MFSMGTGSSVHRPPSLPLSHGSWWEETHWLNNSCSMSMASDLTLWILKVTNCCIMEFNMLAALWLIFSLQTHENLLSCIPICISLGTTVWKELNSTNIFLSIWFETFPWLCEIVAQIIFIDRRKIHLYVC